MKNSSQSIEAAKIPVISTILKKLLIFLQKNLVIKIKYYTFALDLRKIDGKPIKNPLSNQRID